LKAQAKGARDRSVGQQEPLPHCTRATLAGCRQTHLPRPTSPYFYKKGRGSEATPTLPRGRAGSFPPAKAGGP